MDDKENTHVGESSLAKADNKDSKINIAENEDEQQCSKNTNLEDAGPSGNLPGSVPIILQKTRLSKSEHNIRHIITCNDVANALKLNSMSFGQANRRITDLNLEELQIPKDVKDENVFVDIKKFMAACFQNKDEIPKDFVIPLNLAPQAVVPVQETTAHTSVINAIPNEVVTKVAETKSADDKKKTSGSLSERSELGLGQRDSLSSIGSNVCRICMTRGRERLISPCNCKGSLANVHLSCLERWLNQVGRNHCELCGYSYPAIRTPRYTVLQALRLWFGNPRNRGHLQSDCLIFWLLSTVTAGLLAVCVVGTQYFVVEGNKFGISHRITESAMDFFMAIVLCGYSVTVFLLWKDHFVMWNRWRRANVNVRLLLSADANPVPFLPRRYHVV